MQRGRCNYYHQGNLGLTLKHRKIFLLIFAMNRKVDKNTTMPKTLTNKRHTQKADCDVDIRLKPEVF